MSLKAILQRSARPLEIAIGLFFIFGAVLKAYDIELFWKQIVQYGILRQEVWLNAAAVGTVGVEALLGAALVVGWRLRGLLHAAVALLLVGFTALIAYAWIYHDLEDCGCLGKLEMTPGISILKNLVLLALTGAVYAGTSPRKTTTSTAVQRGLLRGLALAIPIAVMGYAFFTLGAAEEPEGPAAEKTGLFSAYTVDNAGQVLDLGQGSYVVAVLSATCPHCRASVPAINDLMLEPDLPLPVGLIYGEPEEIEDFRTITQPLFPLQDIPMRAFFSLIGSEPPRFYVTRDGEELTHWDDEVPSPEAIRGALQ
jgi:hypothetical protein